MRTGASRFPLSFLWMQRKLTSAPRMTFSRTLMLVGMAEMKAQSVFPLRMPTCHSFLQPGDSSDLRRRSVSYSPPLPVPHTTEHCTCHLSSDDEYLNLNMASSSST